MAKPKVCEHDDALALEDTDIHKSQQKLYQGSTVYNCPNCGEFFLVDDNGEIITTKDPTEPSTEPAKAKGASQAGKASSPRVASVAGKKPWSYHRGKDTMVPVTCSWEGCEATFKLYPQNVQKNNWCPARHRPLIRTQQARDRQIVFRQKHGKPR